MAQLFQEIPLLTRGDLAGNQPRPTDIRIAFSRARRQSANEQHQKYPPDFHNASNPYAEKPKQAGYFKAWDGLLTGLFIDHIS